MGLELKVLKVKKRQRQRVPRRSRAAARRRAER
jgi:hypothetical protein